MRWRLIALNTLTVIALLAAFGWAALMVLTLPDTERRLNDYWTQDAAKALAANQTDLYLMDKSFVRDPNVLAADIPGDEARAIAPVAGVALALIVVFQLFAWRNAAGLTAAKRHEEAMRAYKAIYAALKER